jgi:deoxyribodipyrimidine photo-lyase
MAATIVWFRQDLRLQDNPALAAALKTGGAVLPVYIFDERGEGSWPFGGASRWWLHHSLAALDAALREHGSRLLLAKGESGAVLRTLINETGATSLYWNRRYEPAIIARDYGLKGELSAAGVDAEDFNASLLFEPHTVQNRSGGPFQVFTPFWRHCLAMPVEAPGKLRAGDFPVPEKWPASLGLADLKLLPTIKWDAGWPWRGCRVRLRR